MIYNIHSCYQEKHYIKRTYTKDRKVLYQALRIMRLINPLVMFWIDEE